LVKEGREAQLEVALDLGMDWKQAENYFAQVARVEAISTPPLKLSATRIFQSAFEITRIAARRGSLSRQRTAQVVNRLLELDPGSERFAFDLALLLTRDLLGLQSAGGQEVEDRLIAALSEATNYILNSGGPSEPSFYEFDCSRSDRQRIARSLESLRHTRLRSVIEAFAALEGLEKSASDAAALDRLRSAVAGFIEPEPPPIKGKRNQPVVRPPTLKETISQSTAPLDEGAVANLRNQIAPFLGEALVGAVYAALLQTRADEASAEIALRHNLVDQAWGDARYDEATRTVRGSLARVNYALSERESRSEPDAQDSSNKHNKELTFSASAPTAKQLSGLRATLINSFEMVDHRLVTDRSQEYVARSIDLGEDVLGLYLLGEQSTREVIDRLEEILSARRAQAVRVWLDQGDMGKAVSMLSLSELYFIGQRFFRMRLELQGLSALTAEPGALGAIARVLAAAQVDDLKREVRQFGVTASARDVLMRLDLRESETYERALSFDDTRRLAERFLDFKLALARACFRRGHSASLPLSSILSQSALRQAILGMKKTAGRLPPDTAWQDALAALGSFDETMLASFITRLTESENARALNAARWNDDDQK
jgi:hypothetical protein